MPISVLPPITDVEVVAAGNAIREVARLRRIYGPGRWRKCKGVARVRLADGAVIWAEVHWYEAHGIGAFEHKIKRPLEGRP